ncbi:MAG: undecaprenyldiphospho-muramoylpentapeptide beta-N-acetylglucosaminyltransferase [Rhodospirillaceae bacterium]|nr:undecaprenyldiphospho-muramoylpentapeptide beta-N-acetylglucosaminyltransferase [Rhodospirillaceae bacterium]MBT3627688.1 undecaprenyldiphospho-muramoylpentapeptide beta-N-acetylglucosaminyltransferase [Rhodospirillaceae bacterium]MBT3927473.1 undecaprenyldiphospho-muramoylpentapeptide beta-N-acetylglucosaminyltransferase [Rhodospirillaceae bacterium]MBT5674800.1 undecaprenyldiphospho-muramoylpentapeptide beta-N-acetylglucosaminyltransferase [Rhodospirillaceae bacterium]MBT7292287.1 undecapr
MSRTASSQAPIVLAAGGTGGHVFPAQAVAAELEARGRRLVLITDRRGIGYGGALADIESYAIQAGTPLARGPLARGLGIVKMLLGIREAGRLLRRLEPAAVIGFGGYPSVPAVIAASRSGMATAIHEQNAILGRANRLLASRAQRIATSFEQTSAITVANRSKITHTGNPVRPAIMEIASSAYPKPEAKGPLYLLITGGSQGARVFAELVPAALAKLAPEIRDRLNVAQHCRPEDIENVNRLYQASGIRSETATFFDDLPARLQTAHLVVCRAGASTVAELATAGRPAILIPYPHATDDHQSANGRALESAGGAVMLQEAETSAERLAEHLNHYLSSPETLANAAKAALGAGRPDASQALADLVESLVPANGDPSRTAQRQAA